MSRPLAAAGLVGLLLLGLSSAPLGALEVSSTSPARHTALAGVTSAISITFDRPVARPSVTFNHFRAFGRWSGPVRGTFSFSNGDQTVTLTPSRPLSAGETVLVNLSHDLQATDSTFLRAAGYAFSFQVATARAGLFYRLADTLSVRVEGQPNPRIYGGVASDLDLDGWLDLTVVNEDSGDLRVLMSREDGTGRFHPFLDPPTPVQLGASPNEPADFDNDGFSDLATANVADGSVSIVLGNGDGTFRDQQRVPTGSVPKGLAVLDVDGDGDLDLAVAHLSGNNLAVLRNDGNGVFGAAAGFEGGGNGEHGLVAGDANNDGITDLLAGSINDQRLLVHLGNGDGTFTALAPRSIGGQVWMMTTGDLNGDGHLDVATANSGSNNGSVLLGAGNGSFGAPVTHPTGGFTTATDLGDLDGDGDLDWVLSSFGGNLWRVLTNNGAGTFSAVRDFPAPSNPGCAVLLDTDNDRRLDLALFDELADVVQVHTNASLFADGFEGGSLAAWAVTSP